MTKQQLAARLARQRRVSKTAAADQLDRVIHEILKGLKNGEAVSLPGLGTFLPGKKPGFRFECRAARKRTGGSTK